MTISRWLRASRGLFMIALAACGGAAAHRAPSALPKTAASPEPAGGAVRADDKLVISGTIELEVEHGPSAVAAIRADVEGLGGRIVHEEERGRDHGWTAHLRVRLPPGDTSGFVERIAAVGRLVSRRIETTDVSRQYFDQEIALTNLRITLERLQALLAARELKTADVLEIERELTRVRGEIERLEGEHRYLQDRIAYATLDLHLSGSGTHLLGPKARVYPGLRGSTLLLVDAGAGQRRVRHGVAASLWFDRSSSLELALYPAVGDEGRVVLATVGGGGYSDFLGAGKRRWLNPFLAGRSGYAWTGRSAFVAVGELGVELVKTERLALEASARGLGLFGRGGAEVAVEAGVAVRVPF
jgi:hypothetical protein